jgi:glycosyltransferase involved in cell wall biosynthesis
MRAVFDGTVVRPPHSGVQLSVLAELRTLAECLGDLSACRFCCGDEALLAEVRSRGGIAVPVPSALRRTVVRVWWQQFVLPRTLRRGGAQVLHALAYTAPLRCPVPYVLNVHDLIALDRPDLCAWDNRWHMRCLLPSSARRAAACIVSTTHVAERLRSRLGVPGNRLHVVPLGVDVERFARPAPAPQRDGLNEGRPYFLFVGNLEPKKDLPTLLDAYAASSVASAADLVVAGRAAWKCTDLVRRLRHWRGPGRVHWLGRVGASELPGLLQHAVALVMPSVEEGFGLPVLEAMAAGTPAVHSDHPALVEAAGGAGLAFARQQPAELARCLAAVATDPGRRRELADAGRARAAQLPWRRWGEGAVALLRQVAG